MTKRRPRTWNPTPPDDTLMTRQEWLNMGGDPAMDEAEEESCRDQVIPPHPPGTKLAKMEPDELSDEDLT